ncbi:MAG: tRNA (guanosine(37)-N1)-methyltransferase TrmD [Candidatus Beckwithbacteria bacterium]
MKIDVLTIFPEMFHEVLNSSIIGRAQKKNLVKIKIHNLRDWTKDKHKTVDDKPFGGGAGMVMKVEIIDKALLDLRKKDSLIILLTPQGKTFKQKTAMSLSKKKHLIFVCGHYEGFDERIRTLVDEEVSIGDYVLTGGELPAMVIIDTVVRLLPGVVGNKESIKDESFSAPAGGLEYPQYTRPEKYKTMKVPTVLLSGNHALIKQWREQEALKRTKQRRADLLKPAKPHQ